MNESPGRRATHVVRRSLPCWIAVGILGGLLFGCDGGESSSPAGQSEPPTPMEHTPPPPPELMFPTELRVAYPEVSAFLDQFLGAWLAGGYEDYRRLVSRAHTPETRERFEGICEATKAVTVEAIEPVDSPQFPSPAWRAVFDVELSPEHEARRGEKRRKIAIVVFQELGRWRMATPADLQPPQEPPPTATSSAPTTSAPSYPWDEEGDY